MLPSTTSFLLSESGSHMPTYTAPGVYVEEVVSSQKVLAAAATAIAAFVGFTAKAPTDDPNDPEGLEPRLVTSWTQFEALYGGFSEGCHAPASPSTATSTTAARSPTSCRIPHTEPAGKPASSRCPPPTAPSASRWRSRRVERRRRHHDRRSSSEDAGDERRATAPPPSRSTVVENGEVVETYTGLDFGAGKTNVATVVNEKSTKVKVELNLPADADLSQQLELLRPGAYALEKAAPDRRVRSTAASSPAPSRPAPASTASPSPRTSRWSSSPTWSPPPPRRTASIDLGLWKAVQTSLISHCELKANRMAVLDAPPGMTPAADQGVAQRASPCTTRRSPRCTTRGSRSRTRPAPTATTEILMPPSGHIAGLWARTDETRGVWKAPANDTIRGVLDVERNITKAEQGLLNPIGINCIRPFGTRGIRVWGARTLASDTDWRYINVRRLFNMVETTIMHGHAVRRLRAQRREAVGGRQAHAQRVPARPVARRRPVRRHRRAGVLRQVRRRDQPAGVDRRRASSSSRSASRR